jgi:peptidoglycan/LPS O-acetylase OafA/YrhL
MGDKPTEIRPYFSQLDGVRAVAALMVMIFHFCHYTGRSGFAQIGQTGVDLFFVLSGFLITTILLKSPAGDWHEIRTFYIRRSLRIFPLYYGYLIATALFGTICSIWFWIYLQNIPISANLPIVGPDHFWSLAIEEQFYLVWPFVVLFVPRRLLVKTLLGAIALALASRMVLIPLHISPFYFTLSRVDGLAAGALLAVYFQCGTLHLLRSKLLTIAGISAAVLLLQFAFFQGQGRPIVEITKFTLVTAFYAGIVGYLVTAGPTPVNRILSAKPLRFVGRISYGLYVFHPFVFDYLLARFHDTAIAFQFIACFSATFAVAMVSWYAYESRFIGLKDKLAPERAKFKEAVEA